MRVRAKRGSLHIYTDIHILRRLGVVRYTQTPPSTSIVFDIPKSRKRKCDDAIIASSTSNFPIFLGHRPMID